MAELYPRIEIVVAGRAVGADSDDDARGEQGGDAGDTAAELEIRARAVHDARAVGSQPSNLRWRELYTMSQRRTRSPKSPTAKQRDVIGTESATHGLPLAGMLGGVGVQERS